jgi:sugar O-acyltransferase (sialic acid O-acetyltransferase NeuD family)
MKDIVILGAGGLGREVLFELRELNKRGAGFNILGFADDSPDMNGKTINGVSVLGGSDWLKRCGKPLCVVIAVGSARVRRMLYERIRTNANLSFPNIIAHDVICSENVTFGEGCIVCFSDVFTVDIRVGSFVLVNNACTIGHDAVLDDFVTLYPGVKVSGNVHIKEDCEIGAGSCIIQGKTVGENTIVGAGAVVIDNLPACCTAVGVPARVIKTRSEI